VTVERTVRVRGRGRVEVAAYGVADAEYLVEKELGRLWPDAQVWVTEVARADGSDRIVEELAVTYGLEADVAVAVASPDDAPGAAFRHARGLLAGSRYARTEWSTVPRSGAGGGSA
jgi:hypothetical protein